MTQTLDIKVVRIYKIDSNFPGSISVIKAFCDISLNDMIIIKGIKLMYSGKNGYFISLPQEQALDKKWYSVVKCLTPEIKEAIEDAILTEYNKKEVL